MTQCSEWAPLVDVHWGEGVALSASETVPSKVALAPGLALSPLRHPAKWLERLAKETTPTFAILGGIITCFISRRRWLFIFTVPAYYLIFQSTIHTEFRYIPPMHYFLAIFAESSGA